MQSEDRAKHCFKNEWTLAVFVFCSTPKTSQCLKDTLELETSLISTTIQTRGILTTPVTKDTPAPMVDPGIAATWTIMLINRILTTQPIIQVVGELAVETLLLPRKIEPEKRQLLKGNWVKLTHSVMLHTTKKSIHFEMLTSQKVGFKCLDGFFW